MPHLPNSKPSILVVDDVPENVDVLKELLNRSYTIRPALTGEIALVIAATEPQPDLILLDIMMPEMDGYEVMRRLQASESTRDIPVIFVTALSEMESELSGLELGAVDYITKPFNPAIVKARIQTHLALREARMKLEIQALALRELNQTLEQRVEIAVSKSQEQERLLIRQSQFAAMGEMVGNIAHQWRQPLNMLNLLLINILDDYNYQEMNKRSLEEAVAKGGRIINKMSETINDFMNFFKPNKEKIAFSVKKAVQESLDILADSFKSNSITVQIEADEDASIYGYPNEYSQVLLNILSNAKDALGAGNTKERLIHVCIVNRDGNGLLIIRDNAGGIPSEILPDIFEPYFTTKEKGTGIGLYMSKIIIENHMNGKLEVRNWEEGAEFTVVCPLAEGNLQ